MEFMEDWSQVIYDHFTYVIVLMNNLEIIDACLLLITTWSKLDAFCKSKYLSRFLLLTKCILLEGGIYILMLDKSCEYPLYSWCYRWSCCRWYAAGGRVWLLLPRRRRCGWGVDGRWLREWHYQHIVFTFLFCVMYGVPVVELSAAKTLKI